MTEPSIVFDRVGLAFGGEAIYDDISFSVGRGEFVCLLGPSGCGKSTSLRLIGDLLAAQSGAVTVDGKPPSQAWQEVAFVFQSPRLAPWRNALANVLMGVELRMGREEARRREPRARELLSMVGLSDAAHKYPSMLSGGERQRVAIARAMLKDAEIVLLDEATSALDAESEHGVTGGLHALFQGRTVVMVAHRLQTIAQADHIVVVAGGRVVDSGAPSELAARCDLYNELWSAYRDTARWRLRDRPPDEAGRVSHP